MTREGTATGNDTLLSDWSTWRERCALSRCDEPVRDRLRAFVARRFRRYVTRCAHVGTRPAFAPHVNASEAWHRFESHLVVRRTRKGKRYKDWLLQRAALQGGTPIQGVESGACLIVRTVARDVLAAEYASSGHVSLDAAVCDDYGRPLVMKDLLQGGDLPSDRAAHREAERLARRAAAPLFDALVRRERIALFSKAAGLPLAEPRVTRAAGCGKSSLHRAYQALVNRLASRVRADFAGEDAESAYTLALLTLNRMKELALDWGRTEAVCADLFAVAEL